MIAFLNLSNLAMSLTRWGLKHTAFKVMPYHSGIEGKVRLMKTSMPLDLATVASICAVRLVRYQLLSQDPSHMCLKNGYGNGIGAMKDLSRIGFSPTVKVLNLCSDK